MLSSLSPEDLIPADHPIRRIRKVVDAVLAELDGEFDAMYAASGRPSVPPETLLKATVLMGLYAFEWGARVRMRGGVGRFGQVMPPVWSSTRSR
jgi:hypothetical protein